MPENHTIWSRSLQAKFLLGNAPFVLLLVGILVGAFEYITFQNKFTDLQRKIDDITVLNTEVLKESLWNLDHERVGLITASIITHDDIVGVEVDDDAGKKLIQLGIHQREVGPQFVVSHAIIYNRGALVEPIGELTIIFSDQKIREAAMVRMWGALALMVLILLVSLVSALIINKRIIGKPLSLLIKEIDRVHKGEPRSLVVWDSQDEIGQVITAFNEMQNTKDQYEAAIHDVNESLEARVAERTQDLLISENRFRDFTLAASDWYWEMDSDLRFSFMSSRFEDLVGLSATDVIGKTRKELLSDEILSRDKEKWQKHFSDIENHRPFRDFEYEISLPDNTIANISISAVPVFGKNGEFKGYRGSGRNITEKTQANLALEKANKAKSEFLSSMSHELRTPLNAILGFAQVLEMDLNDPLTQKQKESTFQIKRGGEHLLDLINDVLNLAKIDSGNLSLSIEPVGIQEVIEDCLSVTQVLASAQEISFDVKDFENAAIFADRIRFKQVMLNLISNAIKYNRKGGNVRISGRIGSRGMQRIDVTDTGHGIPEDKQNELFQPFSRLGAENSNIEGTGIGLTITQRLLEGMDGKIGFESTVGKGSTFWIELPHTNFEQTEIPKSGENISMGKGTGKVLYIEDNPANISLMESILGNVPNVELMIAYTAELGVAIAIKSQPNLILMDINLPGMNGIEALAELRTHDETRDIPVIAITAAARPRDVKAGLEAGFLDYLIKPLNVVKLVDTLTKVLSEPK